jgi:Flp pilus assembly protein TadB
MRVYTFSVRELSWPQRVLGALAALALLIVAFFFLTVALVAGVVIGLAVIARWWWLARRLRRARQDDALHGEYRVVSEQDRIGRIAAPRGEREQ